MAIAQDVIRRAASEADSQKRYQALIATSASVVWRAAADGTILEASRWDEITGQSQPAYAGEGWLDALHPDDRARTAEHWCDAVAKGELTPVEYRVRHPDGSYHWAIARAQALRDDKGAIVEWVGTVTDIQDSIRAADALRESEELLRLAVEATGLGIWELEIASRATRWTPELKILAGLPLDIEVDDDVFYTLVHPDDRDDVEEKIAVAVAELNKDPYEITYRLRRADTGEERWLHEWGRLIDDDDGRPMRIVGAIQDITDRKRLEIQLHASEERWRLALQAGRMVAWERPLDTNIITRSDNAIELMGVQVEHLSEFLACIHPDDLDHLLSAIRNPSSTGHVVSQYRYRRPDGREVWLESSAMLVEGRGTPGRIIGIVADITEKKTAEASLRHAATHDTLTDLLNRGAIQVEIDRAIKKAKKARTRVSLLLLDIDQFKDVNDTVGHDAGDRLLRVTGERLTALVGERDAVARLGGDEFAVVLTTDAGSDDAWQMATRILEALAQPFRHRGKMMQVTTSIGIACFPEHHGDAIELLKDADLALYAAKNEGRSRASLYHPQMRAAVEHRITLTRDMRNALAADQIVPFYQPKIDIARGTIVGFEALARWIHPEQGTLTPQAFSHAFQEPELAIAIETAMLRHVSRDVASWLGRGLDCGRIALNFSSLALRAPNVVERVFGQLASAGMPIRCLEIEVTETVFLDGRAEDIAVLLRRFHEKGVKISLDDFGTGYASLTHLKRFPVDEIKIDQSFVRDLEDDPDDAAIVSAVIGLGRSLGLTTVAEGIETEGQARKLRSWGCDFGQGYFYAKPMAGTRVPWALAQTFDLEPIPTNRPIAERR